MANKVKALIIARGGSERVRHKNIRPFADTKKSLLQLKIEQLKSIEGLDDIVVNSEDEIILAIAKDAGATPVSRDPYYSRPDTPMKEVYRHVAKNMSCDDVLFCNCTNPLIKTESIQRIVSMTLDDVLSINTVNYVQKFMWIQIESLQVIRSLYDPENQPRSQDIKDFIEINFACCRIDRKYMAKKGVIVGEAWDPVHITEEEATDIDTEIDWALAEMLWKKRN